jgi:hypothetical protein
MIRNAEETLHKEQKKLRALNEHFIRIRGDLDFAPVGHLHTQYDDWLLATVFDGTPLAEEQNGETMEPTEALGWGGANPDNTEGELEDATEPPEPPAQDVDMAETDPNAQPNEPPHQNGNPPPTDTDMTDPPPTTNGIRPAHPSDLTTIPATMIVNVPSSPTPVQRMTTRALATAPPADDPAPVHPFFVHPPPQLPPAVSHEDDPLGHLLSYMSKQTEVVRLWDSLLQGLLKAKRLRSEVLRWCKAEAHVGEMSDGEDWVDLEEWGLHEEELKKGRDEDENEVVEGTGRRGGRRGGRGGAHIGN